MDREGGVRGYWVWWPVRTQATIEDINLFKKSVKKEGSLELRPGIRKEVNFIRFQ